MLSYYHFFGLARFPLWFFGLTRFPVVVLLAVLVPIEICDIFIDLGLSLG
jgi:hypothetical protein